MKTILKVKLKDSLRSNIHELDNKYKIEIDYNENVKNKNFKQIILSIFKPFLDEIIIGQYTNESKWGDFCIDTWDVSLDKYDYSFEKKSNATIEYLAMLIDNSIEFEYRGYCKCNNWDNFLNIILNCLYTHIAPYSFLFYVPSSNFTFYLHHSDSFGVFYENMNNDLSLILKMIKSLDMDISYTNDPDVKF